MNKILVLNCGSSSIKFQVFTVDDFDVLAKGLLDRVGLDDSVLKYKTQTIKKDFKKQINNHKEGIDFILSILSDNQVGVIKDIKEIIAVGHRVVHGGEKFSGSVIIDKEVMQALKDCIPLAPLHNPANIEGIESCKELLPDVLQVGVFDTAFHQTLPDYAFMYAIPYEYYEKYRIRRYGFHGTSHRYVSSRVAKLIGKSIDTLKIISCHLGNGSSVAAVKFGKSVDTSMGFTPLEGLYMGTRCGDIDPAVMSFLSQKLNITAKEVEKIFNKKSGLLGISGISSDMREIELQVYVDNPNKRAVLALNMFAYKVKKYIGSYIAAMNGLDVLVFTGGVGENGWEMREMICSDLDCFGIKIDKKVNQFKGQEKEISSSDSKVKVWVVPTNEELMIAQDAWTLYNRARGN